MKRKIVGAVVKGVLPAMMVLASNVAHARMDPAAIEIAAMGIAAYEANKDKCVFEDVIHSKFPELDAYFRNEAPYGWDRAKRKATMELSSTIRSGMLGTDTTKTGPDADCMNAAKLMHLSMVPAMFFVMTDPTFGAALKRLSDSGAKSRGTSQQSGIGNSAKAGIDLRLDKNLTEMMFSCVRVNLNLDSNPKFYLDCVKKISSEYGLSGKQNFQISYTIYKSIFRWSVNITAPIKFSAPELESERCLSGDNQVYCMLAVTHLALNVSLALIREYENPKYIEAFRAALVEGGG